MRVVLTTFGTSGDLNPYLALAAGLAGCGHTPVIATHEHYRPEVESRGVAFRAVRPDARPEDEALFRRAMDLRRGPEVIIREIVMPVLRESWADTAAALDGADLAVSHPLTFTTPIVAAERSIPWVSTVLAPLSFFSRTDPPVPPPAPWLKRLDGVPGLAALMGKVARAMTSPWVEPVRRLREERGLPPAGHPLFDGQHSPLAVLALFSRVMGPPQPDWPPRTVVTGYLFRDDAGPADGEDERLAAFMEAGPPPIVFTLGTSAVAVAGRFYEESLAAARRVGVRAVLLVGRGAGTGPADLGDDAIVVDYAPHAALFPRAAAIVHHGGAGTLGQALRAGRPMVIVPHAHDQPDNAWRAARLGVARVVPARRYRAARVAEALNRVMRGATVERVAEVSRIVRSEDGVAAACDAIEAAAG